MTKRNYRHKDIIILTEETHNWVNYKGYSVSLLEMVKGNNEGNVLG